tara:strand:+ start:6184 stop:6378 length:195 start_codon:yes stop_codon:yes gene_type:complete
MSNNEKYVCFNCVEYESWITKRDAEIERLRELLLRCKPQIEAGYGHGRIDRKLILELEREVGDE